MTWAPFTPSGFMPVRTPPAVRRIVPSRFETHLFAPLSNAGGPNGLFCMSLENEVGHVFHVSTVVSQDELGKGAPSLYERFVVKAIAALDQRAKKSAA